MEDRLITVHPNTSADQTQDIIERTAKLAAGDIETVDERTIKTWKVYYESLSPVAVVIPFSKDIAAFVNKKGTATHIGKTCL